MSPFDQLDYPAIKTLAKRPDDRVRWRVSQLLRCSPFDDRVMGLTIYQMEWMIAQYELDDPDSEQRESEAISKRQYESRVALLEERAGKVSHVKPER